MQAQKRKGGCGNSFYEIQATFITPTPKELGVRVEKIVYMIDRIGIVYKLQSTLKCIGVDLIYLTLLY